jgi:pimeloyl-ACP methyl ester carboxylesterase
VIDPALHVEEFRAAVADAPLVVLVHGLDDSSLSFAKVVDELVPDVAVVTYDRRGWGRSRDARLAESLEEHARDLLAVIDGRPATVVGHSYGGAVSMLAAILDPAAIRSLALFESTLSWTEFWPDRRIIDEQRADEVGHASAGLEDRPRRTVEQRARDREVLAHDSALAKNVTVPFEQLRVPLLIGSGGLSARWRREMMVRLSEITAAEIVVVEGAGHTAPRMQPQRFAEFARRAVALAPPRSVD